MGIKKTFGVIVVSTGLVGFSVVSPSIFNFNFGSNGSEHRNLEERTINEELSSSDFFDKAYELQNDGDLDGALLYYEKLLSFELENHCAYNNIAIILEERNKKEEALEYYEKARTIKPGGVLYSKNIANLLVQFGKFAEAYKIYADLGIDIPDFFEGKFVEKFQGKFTHWGGDKWKLTNSNIDTYIYSKDETIEKGQKEFSSFLETQRTNYSTYKKGISHFNKNEFAEAISEFDKVIDVYSDAAYHKGVALLQLEDIVKAIEAFDKTLSFKYVQDKEKVYLGRGIAKLKAEFTPLKESILDFDKVLEINPENAEAYFNKGEALYRKNDLEKAFECFKKATYLKSDLKMSPYMNEIVSNFYKKAKTNFEKGESCKSLLELQEIIKINPRSALALYNLAIVLSTKKEYEKAFKYYEEAYGVNTDDDYYSFSEKRDELFYLRGRYLEFRNFGDPIKNYTLSISLNPAHFEAYYRRGSLRHKYAKYDHALEDLDIYISNNPNNADAFSIRSDIYFRKNIYSGALNDINSIGKLRTNSTFELHRKADCYHQLKEYDKEKEELLKLLVQDPDYERSDYYSYFNSSYPKKVQDALIEVDKLLK